MKTCKTCKYVREDKNANEGIWSALECGNGDSPYFRFLVNISRDGRKLNRIVWTGCSKHEER